MAPNISYKPRRTIPLEGDNFDIVVPHEDQTLADALGDIKSGFDDFQFFPVHQYLNVRKPLKPSSGKARVNKHFARKGNVVWLTLTKLESPSEDGQSTDYIYIRESSFVAPAKRNAKNEFWEEHKNLSSQKIPTKHREPCEAMENKMAWLASGGCVYYILDDDPRIVGLDPSGNPIYEKTPLDKFVLNLDTKINTGNGDRPGITRPTLLIGGDGSFSSIDTEDGNAASGLLCIYGSRKALLCVRPDHYALLNNKLMGFIQRCTDPRVTEYWDPHCTFPMTHKKALISTAILVKWGIPFEITLVNPGPVVSKPSVFANMMEIGKLSEIIIQKTLVWLALCAILMVVMRFLSTSLLLMNICWLIGALTIGQDVLRAVGNFQARTLLMLINLIALLTCLSTVLIANADFSIVIILLTRKIVNHVRERCQSCDKTFKTGAAYELHRKHCKKTDSGTESSLMKGLARKRPVSDRSSLVPSELKKRVLASNTCDRAIGGETSRTESTEPPGVVCIPEIVNLGPSGSEPMAVTLGCSEVSSSTESLNICPGCKANLDIADHDSTCCACMCCVCGAADFKTFDEFRQHRYDCPTAKNYFRVSR
ncbi:hypothetical protein QAD02_022441 [Eretmocerus hayati]|uniref:Uncharacterized protein n=1 Tax=Eretmocerus hayati TaxID=131215 RepID=A0ACC2PT93_9HYME|nr:hypothetical protein QAD02_022441 [Eretmocerus hayati]